MADDQAEQTFSQVQASDVESTEPTAVEEQGASYEDEDEYDPSSTLHDQYQASAQDPQQSEDATAAAAPIPNSTSDVETGPANGIPDPSQNPSRAESQTSTPVPPAGTSAPPQTRTIGGFVVEDDDEDEKDEGDYEPPAALGGDDTDAMPMTMSEDPSSGNANQNTSPDVPSQPAVHSSYSPAPVSNIDPSASGPVQWASQNASQQNSTAPTPVPDSPSASRGGRLPHDRVGILQDRVDEDPRGDIPAWLELIAEHRSRNRLDSARETYEKFLKVFPMAVSPVRVSREIDEWVKTNTEYQADQWVAYATMESELNELFRLEQIFNRTLLTIPNVQLWSVYLDYVRRRNPLTTDTSGQARRVISSAYDLALQYVGMDKDSGNIWTDYVDFIRSGPGTVGGSGWQDQQKMDLLRKAYQKAICVPTQAVNGLWKEYDQFEMGLNKLTVKNFPY